MHGQTHEVEINNIFGLPAHPLLVHIPVVLIPLATVGSLFVAIRGSWRKTFAIPVAVLAIVGAAGVFLASRSGSSLEEKVKETDLVNDHKSAGEAAEPWAAIYGILAVGLAGADWVDRRARARGAGTSASSPAAGDDGTTGPDVAGGAVATATATATATPGSASPGTRSLLTKAVPILAVVTLLFGGLASYFVYEAGHSGAKATWDKVAKTKGESGGEGNEGGLGGVSSTVTTAPGQHA